MKLEIRNGLPLARYAVKDLDDVPESPWLHWGTFVECAEYIQEHNPKDLTSKMCDALNAQSGPTRMGEPVLRAAVALEKGTPVTIDRELKAHPALAAPYGVQEHEGRRGFPVRWPISTPDVYAAFHVGSFDPMKCSKPKEAPARSLEAHKLQVELNSMGPENPLRGRKLNRLELAALDWWRARRPTQWSSVEHVINPTIRCNTTAECKMASMAAELFMQACEVGQLTFEAPVQP